MHELESLPVELIYEIALKMPIEDILTLSSTSKSLRWCLDDDILWLRLIERDLGKKTVTEYHEQDTLVAGQHRAKAYYLDCFRLFSDQLNDLRAFSHKITQCYDLNLISIAFDTYEREFTDWLASDMKTRLALFPSTYESYRKFLNILILNTHSQVGKPYFLPFTIKKGFTITALSAARYISAQSKIYSYPFLGPFIQAAYAVHNHEIVDLLLKYHTDLSLYINDTVNTELFKDLDTKHRARLIYQILLVCDASAWKLIFPYLFLTDDIVKETIYDHIVMLVNQTNDAEEKLGILFQSILVVDDEYRNLLSMYLHTIKSSTDYVGKIKALIEEIIDEYVKNHPNEEIKWVYYKIYDFKAEDLAQAVIQDFEPSYRDKDLSDFIAELNMRESAYEQRVQEENELRDASIREESLAQQRRAQQSRWIADEGIYEPDDNHPRSNIVEWLGIAVISLGVGLACGISLGLHTQVHIPVAVICGVVAAVLTVAKLLACRHAGLMNHRQEQPASHTQERYLPSATTEANGVTQIVYPAPAPAVM